MQHPIQEIPYIGCRKRRVKMQEIEMRTHAVIQIEMATPSSLVDYVDCLDPAALLLV